MMVELQSKAMWWTSVSVAQISGSPAVTPFLNSSKMDVFVLSYHHPCLHTGSGGHDIFFFIHRFQVTGLIEGQWYAYRVRALNKLGASRPCRATDEIQAVDARGVLV